VFYAVFAVLVLIASRLALILSATSCIDGMNLSFVHCVSAAPQQHLRFFRFAYHFSVARARGISLAVGGVKRRRIPPAAMAKLLDDGVPTMALRIGENWQLPKDLRTVLSEPAAPGLARSVRFVRLAGALLVLVNHGYMRELSARAVVLADDHRRTQVDKLWSRLAIMHVAGTR